MYWINRERRQNHTNLHDSFIERIVELKINMGYADIIGNEIEIWKYFVKFGFKALAKLYKSVILRYAR